MTDPQETSANVTSLGSSDGNPDKSIGREDDPAHGAGSDVGGPAGATESTTEDALTGTSTAGADDPDDQATSGV
jgi:hypothetical protein